MTNHSRALGNICYIRDEKKKYPRKSRAERITEWFKKYLNREIVIGNAYNWPQSSLHASRYNNGGMHRVAFSEVINGVIVEPTISYANMADLAMTHGMVIKD